MPKEMKAPRYLPKDSKPGLQVVTQGEYVGSTEGKYGLQYNFMELVSGDHVILGGGAIRWRVEQGHMNEGEVFDVVFEGKEKMEKGDFAGKDVLKYKFLKYEDSELPEAWLKKRRAAVGSAIGAAVGAGSPSNAVPAAKTPESEALDDLS